MPNQSKIYISLLPLLVVLLLVFGAGYFLLADEIKLPKFNKGPQITRIEGFPNIVTVTEGTVAEKKRVVLKSEQELATFLNEIDKSGMLTMREKIDFNKKLIIAVASEVETMDGHRIKVKKVYENKKENSLLISISEIYPGETCPVDINNHIAVDLVALDKTDYTLDFERVKDTEECSRPESTSSTE